MKKVGLLFLLLTLIIFISSCNLINKYAGNEYKVTFMAGEETVTTSLESYIAGKRYKLPLLNDTKSLKFVGWFLNKEFKGTKQTVIPVSSHGDKTYFAKFDIVDSTMLPVNFDIALKKLTIADYDIKRIIDDEIIKERLIVNNNTRYYKFYNDLDHKYYEYYFNNDNYDSNIYYNEDDRWYKIDLDHPSFFTYFKKIFSLYPSRVSDIIDNYAYISDYVYETKDNFGKRYLEYFTNLNTENMDKVKIRFYFKNPNNIEKIELFYYDKLYKKDIEYELNITTYDKLKIDLPEDIYNIYGTELKIKDVKNITEKSIVEFRGIISSKFILNDESYYMINDETASIIIKDHNDKLISGDKIIVKGIMENHQFIEEPNISLISLNNEIIKETVDELKEINDDNLYDINLLRVINHNDNQYLLKDYNDDFIYYTTDKELIINSCIKLNNIIYYEKKLMDSIDTKIDVIYNDGDELLINYLKLDNEALDVDNGTQLDEIKELIKCYKYYNNGNKELLDYSLFEISCDNYSPFVVGKYYFKLTYLSYQINFIINVYENDDSILHFGTYKTLYDIAEENELGVPIKSIGDVNLLIVPVLFIDQEERIDLKNKIEEAFFGNETGYESVTSYYHKSSFGKLNIHGDVAEPISCDYSTSVVELAYSKNNNSLGLMLQTLLKRMDDEIDYSEYDGLFFIYDAPYISYNNDEVFWARTSKFNKSITLDEKNFDYFAFASSYYMNDKLRDGSTIFINSTTYIHEMGHLLGLSDYYDTLKSTTGRLGGSGGGNMMDQTIGDLDPFSKLLLGWIEPTIVYNKTIEMSLAKYEIKNEAILIPKKWEKDIFSEYYLIIYYTPDNLNEKEKGYSGLIDDSGIIIYHVDATLKPNITNIFDLTLYNNDATSPHKLLDVIEADHNNSIINGEYFNSNDLFKVNNIFDFGTWNNKVKLNYQITIKSIGDTARILIEYI